MRLVKQFKIANDQIARLKFGDTPVNPQNREHTLTGLIELRDAASQLAQVPSLVQSANELIATCPYTTTSQFIVATHISEQIVAKTNALKLKTATLIEVLRPLVVNENESTIYLKIPDSSSFREVGDFVELLTKNLEQIFTKDFSKRYSLGYAGVEKGSEWFVLKLLADSVTSIGIDDIRNFLTVLAFFCEYYESIESGKKIIEYVKSFSGSMNDPEKTESQMVEQKKETLVDQLKQLIPLNDGSTLGPEDLTRISNAGYEIGKLFKEKTEIEVSGLIESKNDTEISTKIESLKIIKTREIALLPVAKKD